MSGNFAYCADRTDAEICVRKASCVSVWRRWVHCGSAKHHTSGVSETTGNGKKPTGCYRVPRYDDKRHKGHGFWVASESRRCGNVWKQEAILHRDRKRSEKAQLVRGKDREPDNWIIKKEEILPLARWSLFFRERKDYSAIVHKMKSSLIQCPDGGWCISCI